ncbi:UbiA family prenyltransferase [Duganella sp. FT80W]|uniref:UbiA family prenyltransferase n=1 Tax=Duganella guangzhouensis TaxID=2666084 RepID=A0A6I2L5G6_9BURK|nr:UbiA family prenyltransferase [Duganella guangzhouensis]MRW93020.1 UbiA family prenyltransferase [Duganella guangzhouensis]
MRPATNAPAHAVDLAAMPLCVDCDGTLIYTDLLFESFLLLLKHHFWQALLVPFWLLAHGKAATKLRIAALVPIDATLLPYTPQVLDYLRNQRSQGRRVVLATASAQAYAEAIAAHLQLFDQVVATNHADGRNLSAERKAAELNRLFGQGGYEYLGNSHDDLPVWRDAGHIAVANASASVVRGAQALGPANIIAAHPQRLARAALKSLRPHQWLKNLLVFVPLAMGHALDQHALLMQALQAFLCFGLCASSVYVLNDLLDIDADRAHHRKKNRPFASGALPIPLGVALMLLSLGLAVALLALLPPSFAAVMVLYYASTLVYSFRLKRQVVVDIMMLSGLYTLRILAGAAATGIELSFWLLSFSVFIFLSLALVKRYAELQLLLSQSQSKTAGRGYRTADLPVLLALGSASGFSAIQVLALYINSPEVRVLYRQPQLLWLVIPLMAYWITRVWLKTHRGEMHDDPVVFAAKDWQSLLIGGLIFGIACLAAAAP